MAVNPGVPFPDPDQLSAPPRPVPFLLWCHLLAGPVTLAGAGTVAFGMLFALFLAPATEAIGSWRLSRQRQEAPGSLEAVAERGSRRSTPEGHTVGRGKVPRNLALKRGNSDRMNWLGVYWGQFEAEGDDCGVSRVTMRRRCRPLHPMGQFAQLLQYANNVWHDLLPLAQKQIYRPASSDVRVWAAKMRQDFCIRAAGLFQGVGEHRQAVEGSFIVDGLGELRDDGNFPGEPGGVDERRWAEGIQDYFSNQIRLGLPLRDHCRFELGSIQFGVLPAQNLPACGDGGVVSVLYFLSSEHLPIQAVLRKIPGVAG
jgi:hypothetical protein